MAYNTGNAIGSADARDLYDNAQNLDKAMNSTDPTWIDRFGVSRPTFKGAESELNQKVGDAEAAATQALGYLNTMRATSYGPLAEDPTTDPLGNPCTAGDEYFNTTYNLLKRFDGSIWRVPDINTENLASGAGSSMVGHGGQTVESALNERLPEIGTYALLRAYTGPVTSLLVRGVANIFDGGFGVFRVDAADTTSADNGGTILVDASGRRWKRVYSGAINVKWFGAKGDYNGTDGTDDAAAIQAALNFAGSISLPDTSFAGYGYVVKGGTTVFTPDGQYLATATLTVPQNVSFEGVGKYSTVIHSTVDGPVLRNSGTPTVTGTYDCAGVALRNFSVLGDRTKTNQVGMAFLRLTAAQIENVSVSRCGGMGVAMYQCGVNQINNLECIFNGSHGLYIASGFDTWGGAANNLPSNANVFTFYRGLQNDGAGIFFANGTNGNMFFGADCEYNYYSAGDNIGYNVEVKTDSNTPNCFYGLWTEGPVKAHVYVESLDISVFVKLIDWKHFGNGAAGNVDRALILNTGSATVVNPTSAASTYKTIAGSSAPFRIQNKSTSVLQLVDAQGAGATGIGLVEDSTGARTGLYNNLKQDNSATSGANYGPRVFWNDGGGADGIGYQNDTQSYPWYQSRAYYKEIVLGDGSAAPDAGFKRLAANQVGPRAGDFFNVGSTWNGSHLVMGTYHLWIDASGKLRVKSGAPTSDTDGSVVGAQS